MTSSGSAKEDLRRAISGDSKAVLRLAKQKNAGSIFRGIFRSREENQVSGERKPKAYWFRVDSDGEHLVVDRSILEEIVRLMRPTETEVQRIVPVIEQAFRNKGIKLERRDAAR